MYPGFGLAGCHHRPESRFTILRKCLPETGVISMASLELFGKTGDILHRALSAESFRYGVRAQNLANTNTPLYKRQDVEFESLLAAELDRKNGSIALKKTQARHIGSDPAQASPRLITDNVSTMRYDGNNVDIEREIVALTETAIRYQVLAEQLLQQIRQLRTVISERVS